MGRKEVFYNILNILKRAKSIHETRIEWYKKKCPESKTNISN